MTIEDNTVRIQKLVSNCIDMKEKITRRLEKVVVDEYSKYITFLTEIYCSDDAKSTQTSDDNSATIARKFFNLKTPFFNLKSPSQVLKRLFAYSVEN